MVCLYCKSVQGTRKAECARALASLKGGADVILEPTFDPQGRRGRLKGIIEMHTVCKLPMTDRWVRLGYKYTRDHRD
jgi:hypothetical protein